MSLIPNDAGIRMRLQTDEALRPLVPIQEIPVDLTDLSPGTRFSARIQEVLPENTYKALVAGRSLTLALPESAKAGDTLELVVVDRSPRTIVAQLATTAPETSATSADELNQFTTLSKTAQLIGSLLAREGEKPSPAILNRGQALLAHPPSNGAELLPQLTKAVSQSGIFYEAHQVQWALGQRPLTDLLAEPQGSFSKPEILAAYRQEPSPASQSGRLEQNVDNQPSKNSMLNTLFRADEPSITNAPQGSTSPISTGLAAAVPEELRPLVQQQLESAATQRMAWHGEVWPGQQVEWEIEHDAHREVEGSDEQASWSTFLRLTTPRLGKIDARLRLSEQGVQIVISTPYDSTAGDLLGAASNLQQSLSAAGVPLIGLQVKQEQRNE